jgi:type II secretory pathway component GspD/PulD (secretin)
MKLRHICLYLILLLYTAICFAAGDKQEAPPVMASSATEPLLTLSCKEADVRDVLRGIAMQYGINIVPDSNVVGNVTTYLQDAPFETGLATLLETNGFEYEKRDGIYLVHIKDSALKSFEVSFQDDKLTLDAENADVRQLLREISVKTAINIVSDGDLTGNITAHLSDVPLEEALYSLMTANGFIVDESNGIYRIRSSGVRTQQRGMGSFSVLHRNGKLTIDAKNTLVADILSEIASQAKVNLATVGNIQGTVTARLDGVTLEQALDTLTDATGTVYTVVDEIYMVGDPTVRPGQTNPLLERKVVWLKHIEVQDLINSLPSDIPKTSVTISQDRNALIVLGSQKTIQQLEKLLEEIDVEDPDIRSRQQTAIAVEVDDDGLLTIDAKDAPMETLLREISIRKGIDMTLLGSAGLGTQTSSRALRTSTIERQQEAQSSQPSATSTAAAYRRGISRSGRTSGELVNFRISKATLEETFDALFKGTEYTYKKSMEENREFYIIGTGDLIAGADNPLVVSKKISLQYLKASTVMDILPLTIPDPNIIVIEDQNAIVIMGTPRLVDEVEKYLAQVDSPTPQIMIEALLIEVASGNTRELGINWSWFDDNERNVVEVAPGLFAAFDSQGWTGVPKEFFAALNALVSENKARVLAKPRVATTNGVKATMNVGWTEYFETTTEIYRGEDVPVGGYTRRGFNTLETGIMLEITPWVGAAEEITVLIHPDIKEPKIISKEHSTITQRTLDTTVRVKDGETIVIGGLIQRNETASESKVPVLGSIPLLGNLFKESRKEYTDTELIIVVKPKLIDNIEEPTDEAR